jgi:hypothetical protein
MGKPVDIFGNKQEEISKKIPKPPVSIPDIAPTQIPELREQFKEQLIYWKKQLQDQHMYIIPRINFNHQYKLKKGLAKIYEDISSTLERFQDLQMSEVEWNTMIEYCLSKITKFVGKFIRIDTDSEKYLSKGQRPSQKKASKSEIDEKNQQISAQEFMEIRNEFDKEETTINEYVNISTDNLANAKLKKMNTIYELKFLNTPINIDPTLHTNT